LDVIVIVRFLPKKLLKISRRKISHQLLRFFLFPSFCNMHCLLAICSFVATLALGLWPKQGLAKVWAKSGAWESSCFWDCKSVEEWTFTLLSELSLWELESKWTTKFSEGDYRSHNSLDWRVPCTIENLLERKCLKWAHTTHLGT
jgi:hypothetical protein